MFEKVTRCLVYGQLTIIVLFVLWGCGIEDVIRSALGHGKIAQSIGKWVELSLLFLSLLPAGFSWGVVAIVKHRFDPLACLGFFLNNLLLALFILVASQ